MAESLQPQIPESNGAAASHRSSRVYMLALLFAAAVLNATDRGIFAIAMPAIKHEYSFTDSQLGLLGESRVNVLDLNLALDGLSK